MKAKWDKPELVVLLRSRPEEAVLDICKSNNPNSPSGGSISDFAKCATKNTSGNCAACRGEGGGGAS